MDLQCLGPAELEKCRPTQICRHADTLTHTDTLHSDTKIHIPSTSQILIDIFTVYHGQIYTFLTHGNTPFRPTQRFTYTQGYMTPSIC